MRASALGHARFPVSPFLAGLSPSLASRALRERANALIAIIRWPLLSHHRYHRIIAGPPAAGRAKQPCTSAVKWVRFISTAVVAPPTPFCTVSFNRSREEALNGQPVPQLRGV
jgi:hypothetical protein